MKKRIFSLALVFLLAVSYLTVLSSADTSLETENSVITSELLSVMASATASEKIPVSIWTTEIDTDIVEEVALAKTGYNKESIRALVEEGKGDTVTLDDVNNYIAAERRLYAQLQTQSNQAFVNDYAFLKTAAAAENAYVCSYAPMIVVELTKSQIETLAKDSAVNTMYYSPKTELKNEMDVSLPLVNAKANRDTNGYTGQGVRIGMVECGVPDADSLSFSGATLETNSNNYYISPDDVEHATAVAEIMISNDTSENGKYKGIVPDATLICVAVGSTDATTVRLYEAIEDLLFDNVHVINMSAGFSNSTSGSYTDIDRWVDHIAHNHSVHFVVAAGNYTTTAALRVSHPALAYNAIAVGNLDDNNTPRKFDDVLSSTSCYVENSNAGPNKPDLVAPGVTIKTSTYPNAVFESGYNVSGTSFAAPHVTGIVAQLIDQYASLAVLQDLTKAILTAAIDHSSCSFTSNDTADFNKYGAGCVNALNAAEVSYRGTFASSAFTASSTTPKTYTFNAPSSAEFVRGSLVWLKSTWYSGSNHTGAPAVDTAIANLSITVITPNGLTLTFNNDGRTNMIIFELDPDVYGYGNYTVRFNTTGSVSPTYFGFAWWY